MSNVNVTFFFNQTIINKIPTGHDFRGFFIPAKAKPKPFPLCSSEALTAFLDARAVALSPAPILFLVFQPIIMHGLRMRIRQ